MIDNRWDFIQGNPAEVLLAVAEFSSQTELEGLQHLWECSSEG
jgi:hypothetical protein